MKASTPQHESDRINALQRYQILDTPAEKNFDELIYLASQICEAPIALISLIDTKRQWFKAKQGLDICETHRDYAFCAQAILDEEILIIPDATQDDRFKENPLVTGDPNIRFYAGAPLITPDHQRLGTLCVIDRKPRQLSDFQLTALRILSKQVMKELELYLQNRMLKEKLEKIQEQKEAIRLMLEQKNMLVEQLRESNTVRERVLSIMAHDLRSPLNTVQLLLSLLGNTHNPANLAKQQQNIQELSHVLETTTHLLDNLLEWGMIRLTGQQDTTAIALKPLVEEVLKSQEYLTKRKNNKAINHVDEHLFVQAESSSLALILRNLITNANKFTQAGQILISGHAMEDTVCIVIADTGIGMHQEQLSTLFSWNKRTTQRGTANEKGIGMGLPICADMLHQMRGRISAESIPDKGTQLFIYLPKAEPVLVKTPSDKITSE